MSFLMIAVAITLFISLFLSFFLITVKTEHKLSNCLFAAFLVLTAIDVSVIIFNFLGETPLSFVVFRNSLAFLQLPFFYLYVLSVCYADFQLKPKHLIHIAPFLVANLILLPRFYTADLATKIKLLESSMVEIQINHIFIHIQIVLYFIAVFTVLFKTKKIYLENYAGASVASFKWLFQLTWALSFFYFIVLLKNIFKFAAFPGISEYLKIAVFLLELLIISWYLFKALNNPSLFRSVESRLKPVSEFIYGDKKGKQINVNIEEYHQELLKLEKYMVQQKPFLNPSITIENIANDIETPTRDLSLLINHQLGQHFFDFINSYRIENAISVLKDSSKSKVTILEILYEVGFNSKSSFNTAFKKHTGTTPTEYRKHQKNNTL